eukprot:COSAG02_NODE_3760_length_6272_cov_13.055565_1_plen_93_part_00
MDGSAEPLPVHAILSCDNFSNFLYLCPGTGGRVIFPCVHTIKEFPIRANFRPGIHYAVECIEFLYAVSHPRQIGTSLTSAPRRAENSFVSPR